MGEAYQDFKRSVLVETMIVGHQSEITEATALDQTGNGLPDVLGIDTLAKKVESQIATITRLIRN